MIFPNECGYDEGAGEGKYREYIDVCASSEGVEHVECEVDG